MNKSDNYFKKLNFRYEGQANTLFVVDTNYFLYAYQSYSLSSKYIEALKTQNIYIPFIVFIEFIKNIDYIKEETSNALKTTDALIENIHVDDVILIEDMKKQIRSKLFNSKSFNNTKRIRFQEEVEEKIEKFIDGITNEITDNVEKMNSLIQEEVKKFKNENISKFNYHKYEESLNSLNDEFNNIFNKGLGDKYTAEDISSFIADMDERYLNKIPPGFMDSGKVDEFNNSPSLTKFGDLEFESKAGDLILWKDLIEYVGKTENDYDYVVIVTDDEKEDWKIKKGSREVHKSLKIEFLEKTNKPLDILSVGDFINKSAIDEESKTLINQELEDKKIVFTFNGIDYGTDTQAEMMKYIFERVINENSPESVNELLKLPCLSTTKEIETKKNTIFDSKQKLNVENDEELILGTRLNIQDKLIYISSLFTITDIDFELLSFNTQKINDMWEKIKMKKGTN